MRRIGLMSWESTASYYRLLNEATRRTGTWHQPSVLIDSLDFSRIVELQEEGDWVATGRLLADSARRLVAGGAEVLAICANTMHRNIRDVQMAVSAPVVDVRDAMAKGVMALGASSMSLLGTKYLIEEDFYSSHLERAGLRVVKPQEEQVAELQRIIFEELTQGIVTAASRTRFVEIAEDCRSRGGEVVGLCCTEFGLLLDATSAPWPVVDSTTAHVDLLLSA